MKVFLEALNHIGLKKITLREKGYWLLREVWDLGPEDLDLLKFIVEELEKEGLKQAVFKENGPELIKGFLHTDSSKITQYFFNQLEEIDRAALVKSNAIQLLDQAIRCQDDATLNDILEKLNQIRMKQVVLEEFLGEEKYFLRFAIFYLKRNLKNKQNLIAQLDNSQKQEELFKKWGNIFLFLAAKVGDLNKLKEFMHQLNKLESKKAALSGLLPPVLYGQSFLLEDLVCMDNTGEVLNPGIQKCLEYLLEKFDKIGRKQEALEAILFKNKFFLGVRISHPLFTQVIHLPYLRYLFKEMRKTTTQRHTLLCDFLTLKKSISYKPDVQNLSDESLMGLIAYLFINPPLLDFLSNKKFLTNFDKGYIEGWYKKYELRLQYCFEKLIDGIHFEPYTTNYREKYGELVENVEDQECFIYLLRTKIKEWFKDTICKKAIILVRIQFDSHDQIDQWGRVIIEILNTQYSLSEVIEVLDNLLIEHITYEHESLLSESLDRVYVKLGKDKDSSFPSCLN